MNSSKLHHERFGDGDAFDELVAPYRRELHVHCYRILGSTQDAEDVLQDTLLAAWRAFDSFDGQNLRAWLYRIATNRCRNFLRDATRRPQPATPTHPAASRRTHASDSAAPWWLQPYPDALLTDSAPGPEARYDARESIALSFVAGLQRLPTTQRLALVLRDVLGFTAAEVADMLEVSTASVNSALQRARAALPPRDPEAVALPTAKAAAEVVARFVDAFQDGDLEAVVALLTEDATVTMPPEPLAFRGPQAIAAFFRTQALWEQHIALVPTSANGQPAFGYYLTDPNTGIQRFSGMLVLTAGADGISAITRFSDPTLPTRFGLPPALAARS